MTCLFMERLDGHPILYGTSHMEAWYPMVLPCDGVTPEGLTYPRGCLSGNVFAKNGNRMDSMAEPF